MSETLIPFDFEAFKADPSRLRTSYGERPEWAEAVRGCVVVQWPSNMQPVVYVARHFPEHVRLVAKTRIVRVRLFKGEHGIIGSSCSERANIDGPCTEMCGYKWISDPVEIEILA